MWNLAIQYSADRASEFCSEAFDAIEKPGEGNRQPNSKHKRKELARLDWRSELPERGGKLSSVFEVKGRRGMSKVDKQANKTVYYSVDTGNTVVYWLITRTENIANTSRDSESGHLISPVPRPKPFG